MQSADFKAGFGLNNTLNNSGRAKKQGYNPCLDETDDNFNFALENKKKQSNKDQDQFNMSNMDEVQIQAITRTGLGAKTEQESTPQMEMSMGGNSVVFDQSIVAKNFNSSLPRQ